MVKRDELIHSVEQMLGGEWLTKAQAKDELANGVQVLGQEEVKRVVLGTSLNEDFLLEAIKAQAQMCIFHHGFDVRTFNSRFPLFSQKRLKLIFEHGLTVMGFHYALDAHPELGNNAVIIRELGAQRKEPLFDEWGYTAEFDRPQAVAALSEKCAQLFSHDVFAVYAGPKHVKTIGVVSGAGKPDAPVLAELEAKGVELFISGEPSESTPHKMKESGINYFACGHYATEVFGVQELGKKIKEQFKDRLEVEFIDIPNVV
jgi:dinuclear metal center YbgI/SA1388 family protein